MNRIKKVPIVVWILIAILIVGGIVGAHLWNNRKINVLANPGIQMKYTGYQSEGEAYFNEDPLDLAILKLQVDRSKLPDVVKIQLFTGVKDASDFASNLENAQSTALPANQVKLTQVKNWFKETKIKIKSPDNLKNGDTVTVALTTDGDSTNPVKPATKTYKVVGLKAIKGIPTSKVLKQIDVNFTGLNGRGQANLTSEDLVNIDGTNFTVPNNGKLSNGDKVKIKVPGDYFEAERGKKYVGPRTIEATVKGLIDPTKLTNLKDLKGMMDKAITDVYTYDSSDPNSVAPQFEGFYALPSGDGDDDVTDQVQLMSTSDQSSDDDSDNNAGFEFVATYLIPDNPGAKTGDVQEVVWNEPTFTDNKVDLPSQDDLNNRESQQSTLGATLDDHNTNGVLLIKSDLQK
ncbi:hypothetical protein [Periweissella ghanensis]|uniref:Uncharacterized protein n=1 Tax=Periweissella ghanensis TaxID=467997 RepID=A0ABM8ZBT9_9LACO|nr:hypothetical protein [Periweissella ghanensis]MCM0601855.1 hypothetical protein [Periweissella ghanensis]CAH0418842.1 hypothetical protein WGH24286_01284 [Periweissella ghanensis]